MDKTLSGAFGLGAFGRLRFGWFEEVPSLQLSINNMRIGESMELVMDINSEGVTTIMSVDENTTMAMPIKHTTTYAMRINNGGVVLNMPITRR